MVPFQLTCGRFLLIGLYHMRLKLCHLSFIDLCRRIIYPVPSIVPQFFPVYQPVLLQNYFILSSSMDKTVRLWHISRKECLCCFQHIEFVTAIAFHPKVRPERRTLVYSISAAPTRTEVMANHGGVDGIKWIKRVILSCEVLEELDGMWKANIVAYKLQFVLWTSFSLQM